MWECNDVPDNCLNNEQCILGIDEAGRGPVLGPMIYGAAYWPLEKDEEISNLGFDDSKALSAEKRKSFFTLIKNCGQIGFILRTLSAAEISGKMLQKYPQNLNSQSFEAAIALIHRAQKLGVNVIKVYVDTVGDPVWYENMLTERFKGKIDFTVRKKADALYKVVGAASICAKVTRDEDMEKWKFPAHLSSDAHKKHLHDTQDEQEMVDEANNDKNKTNFGSGYPADERTRKWLDENFDPLFGYTNIARFSWNTVSEMFKQQGVSVKWDRGEEDKDQTSLTQFFYKKSDATTTDQGNTFKKRRKRCRYFTEADISHVSTW